MPVLGIICAILAIVQPSSQKTSIRPYPEGFIFGASDSAYQTEGAWNVDGKGLSIWDVYVRRDPSPIDDGSTGDVACNSYYEYKTDTAMLKELGVSMYRISISWARILPKGTIDTINEIGIQHYSDVIDHLLENGIQPMVTIYHWDLPQALEEQGGWLSPNIVDWFTAYSDILFRNFGDRVKYWITLNEPYRYCVFGYGTAEYAPGVLGYGVKEYQCIHNSLLAHAAVYHLYHNTYQKQHKGKVSMSLSIEGCFPKNPKSAADIDACKRYLSFTFGVFADPVYGQTGNYPEIVRRVVDENSRIEGLKTSRLPVFTQDEIDYIKGTYDFLGVNIYNSYLATPGNAKPYSYPSFNNDINVVTSASRFWPPSDISVFPTTPKGMRELLIYIKERYGNPVVILTENGTPANHTKDTDRIIFLQSYLGELQNAILKDGCNIMGYLTWCIMDDFEWNFGYTAKFGLYAVDFNSRNRTRTPRASAFWYKKYIKANSGPF